VGFNQGYAAECIQSFHPQSHTIIEVDPEAAINAIQWAAKRPHITIIQDTWQNALPQLGVFDAVFFNDFTTPLTTIDTQGQNSARSALQKGKDLLADVIKTLPQLTRICYCDTDLDEFFQSVGSFDPDAMSRFLHELLCNGQISQSQYDAITEKYQLQKISNPNPPSMQINAIDPLLPFLRICLEKHMKKGSRLSCFSLSPLSKFENPEFFDLVITNPNYDYREELMHLEVPEDCSYYKHNEGLIMILEKA
jgi:hypothetical protein